MIVDDHPVVRKGLADAIDSTDDLVVCAEYGVVAEAVYGLRERPDLVLLDMNLQGGTGFDFLKELAEYDSRPKVLMLSIGEEAIYAERCLRAGAQGYLMKDKPLLQVLEAARKVLGGELYASPKVLSQILSHSLGHKDTSHREEPQNPIDLLSDRKLQIFQLLGTGLSNKEIAEILHISPRTVDAHCRHLIEQFGLRGSKELLRLAFQWSTPGKLQATLSNDQVDGAHS